MLDARAPACELWYWRWDRYEHAYDAAPRMRARLAALHEAAAARVGADVRRLATSSRASSARPAARRARPAVGRLLPGARPGGGGRRGLARPPRPAHRLGAAARGRPSGCRELVAAAGRAPGTTTSAAGDADYAAVPRDAAASSGSARRTDEEAARLILCADVGIVPFKVEPFNDAGAALPDPQVRPPRPAHGRRPTLAGVRTWARAVTIAADADAFAAALRAQAGARARARTSSCATWALRRPPRARTRRCGSGCATLGIVDATDALLRTARVRR